MATAQITLTESETRDIRALSQSLGMTEEEILREALEQVLARHKNEGRLAALQQARGIWRTRQDLPDFAELRDEWNRL